MSLHSLRCRSCIFRLTAPFRTRHRDAKALKKTKKALKHRFWTEIYQGEQLLAAGRAGIGSYSRAKTDDGC